MTKKTEVLVKTLIEGVMNKDRRLADNALNALINLKVAQKIKKVEATEKLI